MLVLMGKSNTGKSEIAKAIQRQQHFNKITTFTSRPARDGEVNGVDYHFISEDEYVEKFNSKYFVETGAYNGWFYGTTKNQYDENTVCVLTPHGLRQIRKNFGQEDIVSFYIKVPRRDRLIKLLERGDEIDEAIRRNQSDVGQYDGIEDEVDFVIENEGYLLSPGYLAKQIYQSTNKKGEKPWDA